MIDLKTTYMGLQLKSPLVVSANPLTEQLDNIIQMEDAGAGAVVLFSLFEEQLRQDAARFERIKQSTTNAFAESDDFFPELDDYSVDTQEYLEIIRRAKERVGIPIIASLNGITPEGWIEYAKDIEQAGADALEINVYYIPGDIKLTASDVENRYIDIIKLVRKTVKIPIAVKLNPYFSALGNMAVQMQQAGADALILFNRFYQPDIDIDKLTILPNMEFSHPSEIRLPLLWIAMLYGRVPVSLAATTGVHGANELIKYLLAGADVAMVASVLYRIGIPAIRLILDDLKTYMDLKGFEDLQSFRGLLSQQHIPDPTAYDRNNYVKILDSKKSRS